mmetsp:Transcript_17583/g.51069  ORF Transcript_17583/g.51069 Transcript_17583/m.51069 type:complete len:318 (+) Transcript_17583:214-1167(+)
MPPLGAVDTTGTAMRSSASQLELSPSPARGVLSPESVAGAGAGLKLISTASAAARAFWSWGSSDDTDSFTRSACRSRVALWRPRTSSSLSAVPTLANMAWKVSTSAMRRRPVAARSSCVAARISPPVLMRTGSTGSTSTSACLPPTRNQQKTCTAHQRLCAKLGPTSTTSRRQTARRAGRAAGGGRALGSPAWSPSIQTRGGRPFCFSKASARPPKAMASSSGSSSGARTTYQSTALPRAERKLLSSDVELSSSELSTERFIAPRFRRLRPGLTSSGEIRAARGALPDLARLPALKVDRSCLEITVRLELRRRATGR